MTMRTRTEREHRARVALRRLKPAQAAYDSKPKWVRFSANRRAVRLANGLNVAPIHGYRSVLQEEQQKHRCRTPSYFALPQARLRRLDTDFVSAAARALTRR